MIVDSYMNVGWSFTVLVLLSGRESKPADGFLIGTCFQILRVIVFIVFNFELSYAQGPEIVRVLGLTRSPTFAQFSDSAAHRRRELRFLSSPLDLFVHHSLVRLVARETQLGYMH